ncbi:hypothetical protein K439DRAFT_1621327 [Ramaria rubella]|nr:hypothetical protein K439DRAFT_1621327 [Ramaria rubella]
MNVIKSEIEALWKTYHKKESYFLTKLNFTSKADRQSCAPNKWNAHLYKEVVERNEAGIERNKGSKIGLVDISCDASQSYKALTRSEGRDALSDLKDFREEKHTGKQVSTKAKVQDVSHTMKDISVNLLNCAERNGIDGFVYIVHNTVDFNMVPQMYFTSKEMEWVFSDSLKQDPYEMGVRAEAFIVASHKGVARGYGIRIQQLKKDVHASLQADLAKATGVKNIHVFYTDQHEDQVQTYGYALEGWPLTSKFRLLSDIGSVSDLQAVWDALEKDELRWVKLSTIELTACREVVEAAVNCGDCMPLRHRGKGKTVAAKVGEKRKRKVKEVGRKMTKKIKKSHAVLSSDDESEEEAEEVEDEEANSLDSDKE